MTDLLVAVAPAGVGLKSSDIGVTVQAFSARLTDIAALAVTDGNIIVGDGANWVAESGATARASLGLGTIAVLNSPLPIANGGSGQATAQAAIDALTNVAPATDEHVLTKDTATGNAIFKAAAGSGSLPVVDETAIVFKTGDATITQTHDIDAYSVARVVTWPNAAGTVPLLNVAQTFTAAQKINANSTVALFVEQDGVKDNVLVVDTTNGRVGINRVPGVGFDVQDTMHISSAGNPSIELRSSAAAGVPFIDFTQNATSPTAPDHQGRIAIWTDGTFRMIHKDNNKLSFWTNSGERMTVDGAGLLHVIGTAFKLNDGILTKTAFNYFDWNTGIRLNTAGGKQLALGSTAVDVAKDFSIFSSDKLSLYVNGYTNEAIKIDTAGQVGINVAAPSTRLDIGAGAMEYEEMTAPGNGAANTARLYAVDNGAGKTQLVVIFGSGAAQVLATEP